MLSSHFTYLSLHVVYFWSPLNALSKTNRKQRETKNLSASITSSKSSIGDIFFSNIDYQLKYEFDEQYIWGCLVERENCGVSGSQNCDVLRLFFLWSQAYVGGCAMSRDETKSWKCLLRERSMKKLILLRNHSFKKATLEQFKCLKRG